MLVVVADVLRHVRRERHGDGLLPFVQPLAPRAVEEQDGGGLVNAGDEFLFEARLAEEPSQTVFVRPRGERDGARHAFVIIRQRGDAQGGEVQSARFIGVRPLPEIP